MGFEIIIDKNIAKIECVYYAMGSPSAKQIQESAIILQYDKNISKLLLANDLLDNRFGLVYDVLLGKRTEDKTVKKAVKLIKQVKIPNWKEKKNILLEKKKELKQILDKHSDNIKKFIKTYFEIDLPKKIFVYLIYVPSMHNGLGGSRLNCNIPAISLRISKTSDLSKSKALITHELLHLALNYSKYKGLLCNDCEEALLDLMMYKIENKKVNWQEIMNKSSRYRNNPLYSKISQKIYDMIKPILDGKDGIVWDYLNIEELKKDN